MDFGAEKGQGNEWAWDHGERTLERESRAGLVGGRRLDLDYI